jgi:CheY-like chemotaxis protein
MPFAAAMRVLIVDDQLTSRLLIRGGLQDLGVSDIEMASNGEEGFQLMKTKPAHDFGFQHAEARRARFFASGAHLVQGSQHCATVNFGHSFPP